MGVVALPLGVAASVFGGSRIQIAGPTGAFIVILAGVVAHLGVGRLLLVALLPSASTIAMVGAIESPLSGLVADGMAGTRHDPNQQPCWFTRSKGRFSSARWRRRS